MLWKKSLKRCSLKKLFVSLLLKTQGGLSKLGAYLMNKVLMAAWDYIQKLIKNEKRKKEQEAAQEKFDEVVKNPSSTIQDKAQAYEDMINAGRKK